MEGSERVFRNGAGDGVWESMILEEGEQVFAEYGLFEQTGKDVGLLLEGVDPATAKPLFLRGMWT